MKSKITLYVFEMRPKDLNGLVVRVDLTQLVMNNFLLRTPLNRTQIIIC